ncbi:MAG TPA: helix-turn-helix domain-containing protein [Thermoguttaceae bacterium]|nr:helix-turn-helix domain-containing protein [Thermoguttaceae bacterium]
MSTLNLLNLQKAAVMLGVSRQRVQQFCEEGRLGQKVGSQWVIPSDELEQFSKIPRPNGKPPKKNRRRSASLAKA